MPCKRSPYTELERLEQELDLPNGKEKVFFTDIALAFSADVVALHEKYEAVRSKLISKLGKRHFQKLPESP